MLSHDETCSGITGNYLDAPQCYNTRERKLSNRESVKMLYLQLGEPVKCFFLLLCNINIDLSSLDMAYYPWDLFKYHHLKARSN